MFFISVCHSCELSGGLNDITYGAEALCCKSFYFKQSEYLPFSFLALEPPSWLMHWYNSPKAIKCRVYPLANDRYWPPVYPFFERNFTDCWSIRYSIYLYFLQFMFRFVLCMYNYPHVNCSPLLYALAIKSWAEGIFQYLDSKKSQHSGFPCLFCVFHFLVMCRT